MRASPATTYWRSEATVVLTCLPRTPLAIRLDPDHRGTERSRGANRRLAACLILAATFVILASARIVATHRVFSATWDEPLHIAAGLELLSRGTYTHDLQNAPLPRVAAALGPFLAGARSAGLTGPVSEGNAVIVSGPGYRRNLELARAGTLPFFLLACVLLYVWTRSLGGDEAAAAATAIFCLTPPVLAHAGLATTDVAGTAAFAGLLPAFSFWLDRPDSTARSAWLGVAGGFALACKFSLISYFIATALGMIAARWLYQRRTGADPGPPSPRVPAHLALAGGIALLVLWASYGFSVSRALGFPAPLSEFVLGLRSVVQHNATGNVSYLLGRTYVGGRWTFFPIALAVKSPLPLLGLALGGGLLAARRWRKSEGSRWLDGPIAVVAPLAVACGANLNLGIRHVLPIFPALAMLGGCALVALWRHGVAARGAAVALSAWLAWGTWRIHPDYLAYFNEVAARDPGAVLVDSDLDWGQDVERLADTVRARDIATLSLSYFGTGDRAEQLMPAVHRFGVADRPPTGWFAVSETNYRRGLETFDGNGERILHPDALAWLRRYQPAAWIGHSIRLYDLPPDSARDAPVGAVR